MISSSSSLLFTIQNEIVTQHKVMRKKNGSRQQRCHTYEDYCRAFLFSSFILAKEKSIHCSSLLPSDEGCDVRNKKGKVENLVCTQLYSPPTFANRNTKATSSKEFPLASTYINQVAPISIHVAVVVGSIRFISHFMFGKPSITKANERKSQSCFCKRAPIALIGPL